MMFSSKFGLFKKYFDRDVWALKQNNKFDTDQLFYLWMNIQIIVS